MSNAEINSDELLDLRRAYSLYIISNRSLPHASDGLKSAARRILWKARDGRKIKSATLAGNTLDLHPHASPEGSVNTLAAFYGNNTPLLTGIGAFGTLTVPTEFGASRYTSVKTSEFTNDVMFTDIDIVPMVDNYDETLKEPKHFLPIIPTVLLNPQDGIADGFATNILPRALDDIIKAQLAFLKKDTIPKDAPPKFAPIDAEAVRHEVDNKGTGRWFFRGSFKKLNATTVVIDRLPYGITHAKFKVKLDKLEDVGTKVISYADETSDTIKIEVKFKRGVLSPLSDDEIIKLLSLEIGLTENLNVIDFNSESVYAGSFADIIMDFSTWRLDWYKTRYERLRRLINIDIQRYKDIISAIDNNVGGLARKTESREELKELLEMFEIVNLDYVADLSVYRFTEAEKKKTEDKLKLAEEQLAEYNRLLASKNARKEVFIAELEAILANFKKGKYNNV